MADKKRREQQEGKVLTLAGVSKTYGGGHTAVTAISDVSLEVSRGQAVLIMGPSGSGKTTLLSIAGALLRPSSGSVTVGGNRVTELSEWELPAVRLRSIGFIFQSFNLLSALTAAENVQVVMDFARRRRADRRRRANDLLTSLGLSERLHHYPHQLSGGEKRRVAIARAIANDPELILADEPTANLDSKTGHGVVELLHSISKDENRGVVIVSHDMRIMDIADRVMRLEDGRLHEGPEFLVTDPVCGMVIAKRNAVAVARLDGQDFYFCSETCRDSFMAAPENYLPGAEAIS